MPRATAEGTISVPVPAMPSNNRPATSRDFRKADRKRIIVSALILAVAVVCFWFMLPGIQSLVIPHVRHGTPAPWVLRPILAFRFGAMAMMTGATVPLIVGPLKRKWQLEDAARGKRSDRLGGRPASLALFVLKGTVLLIVYGAALIFYLSSWETVGPDGIEQHLPWTTLHHSFEDIVFLETIPDGERSDSLEHSGPWYSIKLRSGRSITWSLDNEGTTPDELTAITTFVADHCGLTWAKRSDTRAR